MGYRLIVVEEGDRFSMPTPTVVNDQDVEAVQVADFLCRSFNKYLERRSYGRAWRSMGAAGNLVRIDSKVARLKSLMWFKKFEKPKDRDAAHPESIMTPEVNDSLLDLPVLAAFMDRNMIDGNLAGKEY